MNLTGRIKSLEFQRGGYLSVYGNVRCKYDRIIVGEKTNIFSIDLFWHDIKPQISNGLGIIWEGSNDYLTKGNILVDSEFVQIYVDKIKIHNPDFNLKGENNVATLAVVNKSSTANEIKNRDIYVPFDNYVDVEKFFKLLDESL